MTKLASKLSVDQESTEKNLGSLSCPPPPVAAMVTASPSVCLLNNAEDPPPPPRDLTGCKDG
jgi:hypothetical protein